MSCPRGTIPYIIKSGDTLNALARKFNTTVNAIFSVNPGVNANNLRVGHTICIPVRREVVPCAPGNRYVIKPGDTFSKIAQRYGISVKVVMDANPGVDPTNLRVGQIVCVPMRRRRRLR